MNVKSVLITVVVAVISAVLAVVITISVIGKDGNVTNQQSSVADASTTKNKISKKPKRELKAGRKQEFSIPKKFDIPLKDYKIKLLAIMTNYEIIKENNMHAMYLPNVTGRGNDLAYFVLSVENISDSDGLSFGMYTFSLTDKSGNKFKQYSLISNQLHGNLRKGEKIQGGVAFEIGPNALPAKLSFDTGKRDYLTDEYVFAELKGLEKLKIFKGK